MLRDDHFFRCFLCLDFVLRRVPQQGHPRFVVLTKTVQVEHLFCPDLYRKPVGTTSISKVSHIPLQQKVMSMKIYSFQSEISLISTNLHFF